jgi:hypothetical protein
MARSTARVTQHAAGSVAAPVVAAVQMFNHNESARLLPNAQQPQRLQERRRYLSMASKGAKNEAVALFLAAQGTRVIVC